nr:hypothetical protein [Nostoc sp. EkiNYC01]
MPVYLYYGEDTYSLNQKINHLVNQNVHAEWKAFNYIKLSGNEKNIAAKVFTEVMTLPFGDGNKIGKDSGQEVLTNVTSEAEYHNYGKRPASEIRA